MPVGAIVGGIATVGGAVISSNAASKQSKAIQGATDQNNATQLQIFNQQRQDLMPWMKTGKAALSQIEQLLGLSSANTTTPQTQPRPQTQPPANRPVPGGVNSNRQTAAYQNGRYDADRQPMVNALAVQGGRTQTQPQATATQQAPAEDQFASFYNSPGYQFRLREGQRQLNTGLASRGGLFSGDAGRAAIEYGQDFASNEFDKHLNRLFNTAGMGQVSTGQSNALAGQYANATSNNNMAAAQAKASSYGTQANAWGNALGTIGGMGMKYWG